MFEISPFLQNRLSSLENETPHCEDSLHGAYNKLFATIFSEDQFNVVSQSGIRAEIGQW